MPSLRSWPAPAPPPEPRARPRLSGATLVALAALAALASLVLAAVAFVGASGGDARPPAPLPRASALDRAARLLADPATQTVPLARSKGRLVLAVGRTGTAMLLLRGLGRAPAGRAYEAWVTPPGGARPIPAGLFSGAEPAVPLRRPVPPGATVAVTLQRAGGASAPTRTPRLVAQRA